MNEPLGLVGMALELGVPREWLREQADAKRVPHVKAGKRYLFNREATLKAVSMLAAKSNCETAT
ncbi:MAG: hypothetical protein AAFX06_28130 [Planctomycetota bacterium]